MPHDLLIPIDTLRNNVGVIIATGRSIVVSIDSPGP
jgi:hypothetical protein